MNTTPAVDVLSVIHEVNRTIRESNVTEGLVTVVVPQPGAGLVILEPLPEIVAQFKEALKLFAVKRPETQNLRKEPIAVGPRVISALLGRAVSVPLSAGKLVLGLREEPMLVDMDAAAKRREFYVQIVSVEAPAQKGAPPPRPRR